MSFWARCGISIEDLEMFKAACEKNGVAFSTEQAGMAMDTGTVVGLIADKTGNGHGYVVKSGSSTRLFMDTDANYNSIVQRLGKNGGRLGRDYTEMVIRSEMRKTGGMVTKCEEKQDGSLVLRVIRAA